MLFAEVNQNSDKFEKNKREIVKRNNITCTNCGTVLGELLQTKKPNAGPSKKQKHIFLCPCGSESFAINTEYDPFFLAKEGYIVESMEYKGSHFISKVGKTDEKRDIDPA